jgi:hypothetical protein
VCVCVYLCVVLGLKLERVAVLVTALDALLTARGVSEHDLANRAKVWAALGATSTPVPAEWLQLRADAAYALEQLHTKLLQLSMDAGKSSNRGVHAQLPVHSTCELS